jgi:hypothetical protein
MPIGADGESFVPISTFRGAPHGSTLDSEGNVRSYNALGGDFTVKTVAQPTVTSWSTNATNSANNNRMVNPETLTQAKSDGELSYLAVSKKTEDYMKRISSTLSSNVQGIMRVNGRLADYEYIASTSTT